MLQKFPFVFKDHQSLPAAPCNMNATWTDFFGDGEWALQSGGF
jgi:hypothetical protein